MSQHTLTALGAGSSSSIQPATNQQSKSVAARSNVESFLPSIRVNDEPIYFETFSQDILDAISDWMGGNIVQWAKVPEESREYVLPWKNSFHSRNRMQGKTERLIDLFVFLQQQQKNE